MKPFACTPADGRPTIDVAGLDLRAVDQRVALDDADARAGEVELVLAVDARQLGRLAADERAAGSAADLGRALDELRDLLEVDAVRGDVVEQHQRLGAARDHVVDAVRREIGAAVAKRAALAREDQLRPDRVGRRGEQAPVVERVHAGERAEAARARRLDRGAQAADERVGRGERHAGCLVRAHSDEQLRVQLGAADRARRRRSARPCRRPRRVEPRCGRSRRSASASALRNGSSALICSSPIESTSASREQLLEPVARRVELDAVAGARRDERAPAAVLLHAQLELVGARERRGEVVLLERDADVVDARQVPLPRLHDDVDGAALELGQPELEAELVELVPGDARLVARVLLADAAVARDELEPELREVARLDLADPARHEVVVEHLTGAPILLRRPTLDSARDALDARAAPGRAGAAARGALRAGGSTRCGAAGRAPPGWRICLFALGIVLLLVALVSPIDYYVGAARSAST